MAKARNPITVSGAYGIDETKLKALGVFDATLAIDTNLFIDPMLLQHSSHKEFRVLGVKQYTNYFKKIITLLSKSQSKNDVAWKAAFKLFDFPELSGTCLGYGAGSIHGSGWGTELRQRAFDVAEQIIALGIDDPDLFPLLALFEKDIGSDRISDMVTNIIIEAISSFNERILGELKLKGEVFTLKGIQASFLLNPYEKKRSPIILLPRDILRDLPIAKDWDGVARAARRNSDLRDRVNQNITSIWAKKTKRDKSRLKLDVLKSKEAFETLLAAIKTVSGKPYDIESDPEGLIQWATKGQSYAQLHPITFNHRKVKKLVDAFSVVREIVQQFKLLLENCGLNKELYKSDKKPKHESTSQRLFFAVAYSYCKANNVDISPEVDTGNGKVDFKFSNGLSERVLVEIKLSTNQNTVSGYSAQLEVYKASQETMQAIYLVIDVGRMGKKDQELINIRNEASKAGHPLSDLEFIDGTLKPSASVRKPGKTNRK